MKLLWLMRLGRTCHNKSKFNHSIPEPHHRSLSMKNVKQLTCQSSNFNPDLGHENAGCCGAVFHPCECRGLARSRTRRETRSHVTRFGQLLALYQRFRPVVVWSAGVAGKPWKTVA
jgi:hypothetical protein